MRNTDLDAKSYFANSIEKFNLNQFGGGIGGPIRKNKTFFFVDGEQKYQLHEIPFTGLVPSLAMRTGDFSHDPFGNPVSGLVIVNPNMAGAATPANPNAIYFQCDSAGNALPAKPDGSQAPGTACNKIPSSLINPIGQAMINLYPAPNANNASAGINYASQPIRQLDETKFDIRLDHTISNQDSLFGRFSYDQAFSFVPGGSPGFAEANAFGSNQRIQKPRAQCRPRRDPCVLRQHGQPGQFWLQPHLRLHHFAGHGDLHLLHHRRRHSQRQPGLRQQQMPSRRLQLRTGFDRIPGRLLVPRRSRLLSVPGWNQHLLFPRLPRLHPQ